MGDVRRSCLMARRDTVEFITFWVENDNIFDISVWIILDRSGDGNRP